MNLFWLHPNIQQNVEWHVDSHVVKIILEATQLLCTAHRVLDGVEYEDRSKSGRKIRWWRLSDDREELLYNATHVNHGCAIWTRNTLGNYLVTAKYGMQLCSEFQYRFNKSHGCQHLLEYLFLNEPKNINPAYMVTEKYLAMPDCYKVTNDPYQSYRNYYVNEKTHLRKYTHRKVPEWFI